LIQIKLSRARAMTIMTNTISFESGAGDTRALRQALGRFATGVTVVSTRCPTGKLVGLTANSFSSVSLDPPLVLWSLRRSAASLASFTGSRHFAVNILAADQEALSSHFARSSPDKFADLEYGVGLGGSPVLPGTLATLECRLENEMEGGDHVIFLGRVLRASYRDGEPLIFSAGSYCRPERLAGAA
jgi:flavin reductase (DIM6/NTAB) family NADH-FMN oxidoreductase RutF